MFNYKGLKAWSDEEWNRLPKEGRPKGAIRFGFGWALLEDDPSVCIEDPDEDPVARDAGAGQITRGDRRDFGRLIFRVSRSTQPGS
jgi:hypothetical protein